MSTVSVNLDVQVTRGALVESRHEVHGIAVDARGSVVAECRDADLVTHWRSCAKPFQVMPLLEADAFDPLGWEDPQLALACASHGGEAEHVAIAAAMLADIGLEEGDLACGPHEPLSPRGLRAMRENGIIPSRLHNNCSGKHAAMLARAVAAGWQYSGYERQGHPVQESILAMVARWTDVPQRSIQQAVDGCGVVVFALPLRAMALSFARLALAADRGEEIPQRIVNAMAAHPFLVGGTERFDTALISETHGAVISKIGAEGVHCFAVPSLGVGGAIKVADGAPRAQYPALLRLLQAVGAIQEIPPGLAMFLARPVINTRGDVVGQIG